MCSKPKTPKPPPPPPPPPPPEKPKKPKPFRYADDADDDVEAGVKRKRRLGTSALTIPLNVGTGVNT